jgi:aldose 1-epimerase
MRRAWLFGVAALCWVAGYALSGCSSAVSQTSQTAAASPRSPKITQSPFGEVDGKQVDLYTLTNANGLVLKVMTYGATVTELHVPDKNGKMADVVLGFDRLDGYLKGNPYMGVTVGRVANRIRDAKFNLEDKDYQVAANDKPHHLHGGNRGWDKVLWQAQPIESTDGPALRLTYVSPDGEEGYPGTVHAITTYTLTNQNEMRVDMEAVTDKVTLLNMAHHSYWNLGGYDSGTILGHELLIYGDEYTPGDPKVPTGATSPVKGTPLDFTSPKLIGKDLKAAHGTGDGYDHNWVVRGDPHQLRPAARLRDPKSGRVMTIESNQPGVQLYTGNLLDKKTKGKGVAYEQYAGLCLETQKFPNSINIPAWRDEVILKPGQTYHHTMIHRFTTE